MNEKSILSFQTLLSPINDVCMPAPPLKKRSYGYNPGKQEGEKYVSLPGNRSIKTVPKPKKVEEKEQTRDQSKRKSSFLLRLVLMPFLLVWLLVVGIFKMIFGIIRGKGAAGGVRRFFGWMILSGVIFAFLGGTILLAWASKDLPDPDQLTDRNIAQSTKIYDKTGDHLLYEIFANEKRTLVEIDEIPQYLIDGVIATEDTKFYEHKGVRPLSIMRAVFYGVFSKKKIRGTSTLTQQLVKNAILTNERTYTRKIKEIILAIRLEQKYNKEQILKIYFNEIPYGSTNYGVQAASRAYFNKDVSELNLQEAATLAGLPQAPTTYLNNSTALKNRRDFVLQRMADEGFITQEEADRTSEEPISIEINYTDIKAPHFVLHVKQQLVDEFGEQLVDTGGLKVITTLDWDLQEKAQNAVKEVAEEKFENANANNAAFVAMDPKNSHVLAMVGSLDFNNDEIDGKFNVATLGKRQPGSSFKPIVYAAAFEKGYTPETVVYDVVTDFAVAGKSYMPRNYDLSEHGPLSMRRALQGSKNIPAVKALYLVGPDKGIEFAERLGYSTLGDGDFGLSLVLGGGEVILLEHVNAYAVFANEGIRHEPVSILKVEDDTGDVLKEWKQQKGERVLDKKLASTVSDVLSDDEARSYIMGRNGILTLADRPVCAKTGTTNNYVDGWTVGYTPGLVAGVWVGNTDNSPMKIGYYGSKVAAPIWNKFMKEALADTKVESFPTPPENTAEKAVLRGSREGSGGTITLEIDKVTGLLATSSTPKKYVVKRTYTQPHSILHYVIKNDPRGPAPEDPTVDRQYQVWEDAIQNWIERRKEEDPDWDISFEEPPTEYDDAHSLELIPTLVVVHPKASSTLNSRQIDTDIRVSAPRGVVRVAYKIDNKFVDVVKDHPFNLNYYAYNLEPGDHTLSIIVEDDIGNTLQEDIPFTLNVGEVKPGVLWSDNKLEAYQVDFPKTFFFKYVKLDEIKEIRVYKEIMDKELVGTVTDFEENMFDNKIMFKWDDKPKKGTWTLIAEVELTDGQVFESDRMTLEIK